jgi:gliding motility-associated-like protein
MLSATAQDGIGVPFTFSWSDGTTGTGANHSFLVSPPVTQNYTVTINDACESTPLVLTNLITVHPLPVPTFISDTTEKCEPAEFRPYVTTPQTDYVTASWFLSDGQFYMNMDSITTTPMMEGSYNVQLVLANLFGCIDSVTYPNYLVSHPLPIAAFKFYPGIPTMFNTEVSFTNFSVGADQSAWTFQDGNPATSIETEPNSQFPEGEVGFYDVQLIVTSDFGCLDTTMQTVEVKPEVILYAPNTFTPDGDEFNPTWRVHIVGIDVQDFHVEIRNRWGQLIWESEDIDGEWDGTYDGQKVPEGIYNWFIRAKDLITDEPYLFKGHINVLR